MIWYAAYGSNLLEERFLAYLVGGKVPGSSLPQAGSADPSPPKRWERFRLPHRLVFAGLSKRWGGGVCFVDPQPGGVSLGRAWCISTEQLADVWRQENGGNPVPGFDDELLARVRVDGFVDAASGWYRRLLWVGELDGLEVVTITAAALQAPRPPSAEYRSIVRRGLMETWGMSPDDAAAYLGAASSEPGAGS